MTAYDVAIAGAGPAGITAALFAAARGARVVLVEAADKVGGTLPLSSGSFSAAGHPRQLAKGIQDDPDAHVADSLRLSHGTGQVPLIRLWQENAADTLQWLFENGLQVGEQDPSFNPVHALYKTPRTYTPPNGGQGYLDVIAPLLQAQIDAGTVTLMLNTRINGLIRDADGRVAGLTAGETQIAAKAVLLATGGYASSDELWRELHGLPRQVYASAYSQGDGLKAARAAGARIDYAENFLPTFGAVQDIDQPDKFWLGTKAMPIMRPSWEVFVNSRGVRFMAEDDQNLDTIERALKAQGDLQFWAIYDARIAREAPSFWLWPPEKVARAFATHPDFVQADTLEALAENMGVEASTLARSLADFNAGQAVGSDLYGRRHMPLPVAEAPFYAVRHYGTSVVTWGGVVTDEALRVVDSDGRPIPGLYAAGEIMGKGTFGHTFLAGSSVSSAMTYGRLLGERMLSW